MHLSKFFPQKLYFLFPSTCPLDFFSFFIVLSEQFFWGKQNSSKAFMSSSVHNVQCTQCTRVQKLVIHKYGHGNEFNSLKELAHLAINAWLNLVKWDALSKWKIYDIISRQLPCHMTVIFQDYLQFFMILTLPQLLSHKC